MGLFSTSADGPVSLLESNHYSTLFLDEVMQLPLWAQAKLLDASAGQLTCRGRVIASSTCDLETAVTESRFYSGLTTI